MVSMLLNILIWCVRCMSWKGCVPKRVKSLWQADSQGNTSRAHGPAQALYSLGCGSAGELESRNAGTRRAAVLKGQCAAQDLPHLPPTVAPGAWALPAPLQAGWKTPAGIYCWLCLTHCCWGRVSPSHVFSGVRRYPFSMVNNVHCSGQTSDLSSTLIKF